MCYLLSEKKCKKKKSSKFILDNELIKKMELKKNIAEKLLRDLDFTKVKNTKKNKDQFWIKKKINEMPYNEYKYSEINPFSVLKIFNNASNH